MSRHSIILVCILVSAVVSKDAAAQWNVARFDESGNHVYTTFGLDPAIVATVGYGRVVPLIGHNFKLSGDVGLAAASLDTRDYRVRLSTQTSLVNWKSVHLTGSAAFITRGTENPIYRGFNFGADFTAAVGFYRNRWFVAGEFGKDKAVITHVSHTDWYKTHFYSDARDGWYLNAGGTYHYGIAGGIALGPAEVSARAGFLRTERLNEMVPPMYASLGVGYGF